MIYVTVTLVVDTIAVIVHRIPNIKVLPGKVWLLLISLQQNIFDQNFCPGIIAPAVGG